MAIMDTWIGFVDGVEIEAEYIVIGQQDDVQWFDGVPYIVHPGWFDIEITSTTPEQLPEDVIEKVKDMIENEMWSMGKDES